MSKFIITIVILLCFTSLFLQIEINNNQKKVDNLTKVYRSNLILNKMNEVTWIK